MSDVALGREARTVKCRVLVHARVRIWWCIILWGVGDLRFAFTGLQVSVLPFAYALSATSPGGACAVAQNLLRPHMPCMSCMMHH